MRAIVADCLIAILATVAGVLAGGVFTQLGVFGPGGAAAAVAAWSAIGLMHVRRRP